MDFKSRKTEGDFGITLCDNGKLLRNETIT